MRFLTVAKDTPLAFWACRVFCVFVIPFRPLMTGYTYYILFLSTLQGSAFDFAHMEWSV